MRECVVAWKKRIVSKMKGVSGKKEGRVGRKEGKAGRVSLSSFLCCLTSEFEWVVYVCGPTATNKSVGVCVRG